MSDLDEDLGQLDELGPRSDIYARGVVTYQLLSGRLPYEAQTLTELALKQQREAPALLDHLNKLKPEQLVMRKLTLPETDDFYSECVKHPNVLKVVALSGGYSRDEANARLARNHGVVASFSRALTEGLSAQQSDAEFNAMLDGAIASIYAASKT